MGDSTIGDVTGWVLAQAYWLWALGIAAVFYKTTRWFCAHLSADSRATLALWLMGATEDRWARQFCLLFDRTFGSRHFSRRCLWRSSVASILAVVALYLLFGPIFGFLEGRTVAGLALWQALLIGAAVNVVPDYLSLLETRWMLQRMHRVRSVLGQAAVLAADLVFTGAIIWGGIALFRWASGQALLSWVEMLAFFSAFSIFFYSSFVTSVWSWLYCLSTWFLRLFTRTPLGRVLDVETDPAKQVALVGAGVILIIGLAAAPMMRPGAAGADSDVVIGRFDDWLCRTFPDEACPHVVRLTPDEERRLAYIERICEGEVLDFCMDQAVRLFGGNDAAAATLLRHACDGGRAQACSQLAWMYYYGRGLAQDYGAAGALYRQGCDGGSVMGCTNLGAMYEDGWGVPQDNSAAVARYRQACDGGDATGCSNLGNMYHFGHGVAQDYGVAVELYRQACDGHAPACNNLGWMYEHGRGVPQDDGAAVALYRQSCDNGHAWGCTNLGRMYEVGRGVAQDDGAAVALYQRACDAGDAVGCNNLGRMYEDGRGVAQDDGAAVALYRQACDGGIPSACDRAQALQAARD